ncbi:MAG: ATP-binding protein [Spirochaetes bacterium]|nr:ATP-binding protein [Spirochaetota bacterium]
MTGYIERITGLIPHTNKSVDIPLDGKNLIITGGNGSGKTSFLRAVYDKTVSFIVKVRNDAPLQLKQHLEYFERQLNSLTIGTTDYDTFENNVKYYREQIESIRSVLYPIIPDWTQFSSKYSDRRAVVRYFEDNRLANITEAKMAQGLQTEIEESREADYNQNVGIKLEQHLLNLRARRSFAITEDNNKPLADSITAWFSEFEKNLKHLFEDDSATLNFNPDNSKFYIRQDNKPPYTFQTLSAGYKAIFDVYADLIMRTKYYEISPLELEGVVFIDEIDSHLHISLQRLILPFFTESFPNVQFIVSTHSPFVLMSTKDALVYDLSKEMPYSITQVKTQNEILDKYLGVPTAMPVWAENSLKNILAKYLTESPEKISLEALKIELESAGLGEFFPESATKILEANQ